jgi:hypothetical protein
MILVGIILVIGGLWIVWTEAMTEGFADTSIVVMLTLGSNGAYYANMGLSNTPNWSAIGGTFKQVSGSMGRIIGVDSGNQANYGTKYNVTGSVHSFQKIPGTVTQVSFSYPMVVGLNSEKEIVYIDNVTSNPIWTAVGGSDAKKTFNYIATNQGAAIGAGTDNKLWYCADIHTPNWLNISTGVLEGISIKNIAFDGSDVAVIDSKNNIYFANKNIFSTPNWVKQPGTLVQVSIRNHMGVGIGTDNNIYFSASMKDATWVKITGTPGGNTWVELYYASGQNVVTFRPAVITSTPDKSACASGYSLVESLCYSNCPNGYIANGTNCSYVPTVAGALQNPNTFSTPVQSCASGFTLVPTGTSTCISMIDGSIGVVTNGKCATNYYLSENNTCMSTCPTGNNSSLTDCIPPAVPKQSTPTTSNNYSCSSGVLNTSNTCSDPCPKGYDLDCTINASGKQICGTTCVYNTANGIQNYGPATTVPYATSANTSYYTLPASTDDQTVSIGVTARYVRIRPSAIGGDGYINFSQIIVLDSAGTNLARGKYIYVTSTYGTGISPSLMVDGNTSIRGPTGVWSSGSASRDSDFVELDLGSNMAIASVRLIGRSDYNFTTSGIDRMKGVQIQIFGSTSLVLPNVAMPTEYPYQKIGISASAGKNIRYVRIRPPMKTALSPATYDGYISLTQIMVETTPNPYTNYISYGKPVFVTSTFDGAAPGTTLVNKNLNNWNGVGDFSPPNTWPNVWVTKNANPDTEFVEIDLGKGNTAPVTGITVSGQKGDTRDRFTGLRIELIYEVFSSSGCPSGYSTDGKICYMPCDTNYTIANGSYTMKGVSYNGYYCKVNVPNTTTTTRAATYIPPCASGTRQSGSLCYSDCPAGSTDTGSNTCKAPNTKRTQGSAPYIPMFVFCTPPLTYVPSLNMCSSSCPAGTSPVYTKNQTTCTKPDAPRTTATTIIDAKCNANEVVQNGVCVSKCPDGSAPDGELCIGQAKVVDLLSSAGINCTSSPYQTSKKWLCDSSSDLVSLMTDPSPTTTYVSPTDQVCVTDDPTTKMYFCITGAEAKMNINPLDTAGADFNTTCATITKRYTDLSNNLTNLLKIQAGMQNGSAKLSDASSSLTKIYNQISCSAATGSKATLCNQIQTAASYVGNNASNVSTTLNKVIPSLQKALDSRSELLGFKTNFQCP